MRGANRPLKLPLLNMILLVTFYLQAPLKRGLFSIGFLNLDVPIIRVHIRTSF